jgi:hypothetical protein
MRLDPPIQVPIRTYAIRRDDLTWAEEIVRVKIIEKSVAGESV